MGEDYSPAGPDDSQFDVRPLFRVFVSRVRWILWGRADSDGERCA
jgi:hypothetical protein